MRATVLLLLLSASGAIAVAPPGPPAADLVRRLGADDFFEREAAAAILDEIGGQALPALRAARTSPDPEVRRRASDLVQRIERREDVLRALRPTRLRLVCKDVPIDKAVADFASRSGGQVELQPGPRNRRITLDTGETTFWEALARLEAAAGLTEHEEAPVDGPVTGKRRIVYLDEATLAPFRKYDGPLVLEDGKPPARPTCRFGALRLQITDVTALPDNQVSLALRITPEPRLAWQGLVALRIQRAIDEHGQALTHLGPYYAGPISPAVGERPVVAVLDSRRELPRNLGKRTVAVKLLRTGKPAKQLRELHGALSGWVRTQPEELVRIAPILASAGKTFTGKDGTVFAVRSASRIGARCTVRLAVTPPLLVGDLLPPGARLRRGGPHLLAAKALRPENCPVRLLDARGRTIPIATAERERPAGDEALLYTVTFTAERHEPAVLAFTERRSVLVTFPFVLKDVPLSQPKRE
jgi:hypothetical protein